MTKLQYTLGNWELNILCHQKHCPSYSKSIDVFSLACIALHLISGEWPTPKAPVLYTNTNQIPVVRSEIERRRDYFDKVPSECPFLKKLIEDRLNIKSSKQPKIIEVCIRLSYLSTKVNVRTVYVVVVTWTRGLAGYVCPTA